MKRLKNKIGNIRQEYLDTSSLLTVVFCALCSVVVTYFLIALFMERLYSGVTEYDSFVAGAISYYNYFKWGDMKVVYLFLFGSVAFFHFFLIVINCIVKKKYYILPVFYGILGLLLMFSYQMIIGSLTNKKAVFYIMMLVMLGLCGKSKEKLAAGIQFVIFGQILLTSIVLICGKVGAVFAWNFTMLLETKLYYLQCMLLLLAIVYVFLYDRYIAAWKLNKINFVLEMCSLIWSLWYVAFVYDYRGEKVIHYFSIKYLIAVILVVGILFCWNSNILMKHDFKQNILAKGAIEIMAVFTYIKIPNPLIRTEPILMFHHGEYAVTSQQLLSYGKIPFFDIFPIHGICDYYYGIINRLFFDGSYVTLEAAFVIGNIIILAGLAAVIKRSCKNGTMALVIILALFNFTEGYAFYYIRWVFVLPYLLILNTQKLYKNSSGRVWFYVMLTIPSICWNPSIGGTAAIAVLPTIIEDIICVIKEIWEDIRKKKIRVKFCLAYAVMLITGILYIPVFIKTVQYIILHSENILIVNSNPLEYLVENYGLHKSFNIQPFQNNYFYLLFSFLIPVMVSLIIKQMVKEEKKTARNIAIQFVIFTYFITNYTFGLICAGERAFIYSGILMLFLIFYLINIKKSEKQQYVFYFLIMLLSLGIGVVNTTDYSNTETVFANQEMIDSEAVFVTEENSSISQIQEGYITYDGLDYINSANEIIESTDAKDDFLDLSNMLSLTPILDLKLMTPYTSSYNMYNDMIQKEVIKTLNETPPKVIFISPYFSDERPVAVRNYWIIRWIQENHYKTYAYHGILFLARADMDIEWAEDAYEQYAEYITPKLLETLPYYWGSTKIKEKYIRESEKIFIEYQTLKSGEKILLGKDIKKADFVRIAINSEETIETEARLHIKITGREEVCFDFDILNGEMLVPIGTCPYMEEVERIETLELEVLGENIAANAEVSAYMEDTPETGQFIFTN